MNLGFKSALPAFILKVGISVALLIWAFDKVDFAHAFYGVNLFNSWIYIFAVIALLVINLLIISMRWFVCILNTKNKDNFSFFYITGIQFISLFAAILIPMQFGNAIARIGLLKTKGFPIQKAILSVLIDRIAILGSILIASSLTLVLLSIDIDLDENQNLMLILAELMIISVLMSSIILTYFPITSILAKLGFKLNKKIKKFIIGFHRLSASPALFVSTLALSLVSMFISVLVIWLIFKSMDNPVPLYALLISMPVISLLTKLPISYNGWGVREGAMVYLLGLYGVDSAYALSASIQYGLIHMLFGITGGFLVFRYK